MRLLAALFLAAALPAQLVLPPGAATQEGWASDGDAWTWRTFRASCRYGSAWVNAPRTVASVAWRADSTYATTYDRLPGTMTLRVGPWMGSEVAQWSVLPIAFQGTVDPPSMTILQSWTPQPFTFVVPLPAPITITQGGLEVDVTFVGPWDPVWGNRAVYWVDAFMNPGGQSTLSDQWLDTVPPYMGCAGWISETRLDRAIGKITMEARYTGLPNAPAVVAVDALPSILGCAHVAGTIFLSAATDTSGWLQLHFNQPQSLFIWTWQAWIYDPTRPPDQCLGSGHYCRWNYLPWPCQTLFAYDSTAAVPSGSIQGAAWVVRIL